MSTLGAGYYEITWGAAWTAAAPLVLRVDGVDLVDTAINIQSDWATESIIVQSVSTTPTFAIGVPSGGLTNLQLWSADTSLHGATAFMTIKKIGS